MNKTVKWILISLGVLIAVLVLVKVFGKSKENGIRVTVEKAQVRTIVETVSATGKVYPEVEVPISPDISGEVTELNVQEGDSVRKGQMLARIYADIYSSQRDEAAARVAQAQATVANSEASLNALKVQLEQDRVSYERNKNLFDQKVISRSEFEVFETRYRTSQANYNAAQQNIRSLQAGAMGSRSTLEMANKNLGRTTIVAPMNGVITSLKVKKGQKVVGTAQMAGTEMMMVADLARIEVRVEVGENDIVKVNVGDSADVSVEAYNNRKFRGVVTKIASSTTAGGMAAAANNDVTNYLVHIRLDPASYGDLQSAGKRFVFRPGMNASADIRTKRKEGIITVPIGAVAARGAGSEETTDDARKQASKKNDDAEAAVSSDALEEVVFVVGADGAVQKRVVTTGIQNINHIEITGGLKAGEEVVTGPYTAVSNTLKSGKKVVRVSKEQLFEEK
jgi:HlyD family secretion protein